MNIDVLQNIIIFSLAFTIAAVGLSLIVGFAGIFNVAHAAIFGIGGYTYAVLSNREITNDLLLILPIVIVLGGAVSVVAALPALRLRGDYFLVASVGFQIVTLRLIMNWEDVSGGPPGLFALPLPTIGGFPLLEREEMLFVLGPVVALVIVASQWVVRSPYGRLLRGLAADEVAVRSSGANVPVLKLGVFVYGGVLAAVAGALYVAYLGVASPTDFTLSVSIAMLAMVLIGGAGSIWGPVLGAAVLSSLPYWLALTPVGDSSTYVSALIFGLVLIIVAAFSPDGVAGLLASLRGRAATGPPGADGVTMGPDADATDRSAEADPSVKGGT